MQLDTGLPTKDETVKTTHNSKTMTILSVVLIEYFDGFLNDQVQKKTSLAYKEPWMQENGQKISV